MSVYVRLLDLLDHNEREDLSDPLANLFIAATKVIDRWERGDLAAAVRDLDAAVKAMDEEPEPRDEEDDEDDDEDA